MKLGMIGLPRSGKATIFEALTKSRDGIAAKNEDRIATIKVPDKRIGKLNRIYNLPKTIYAQVEYFLPGAKNIGSADQGLLAAVRDCDALIHIVRNHAGFGFEEQTPYDDFIKIDQELMLHDLVVVEKRLDRIESDHKRGKKMNPEEHSLLTECQKNLENEVPLRRFEDLPSAALLRGFGLLSAKPMLVLFNNPDDDETMPDAKDLAGRENCMVIRGKLEQELSQVTPEEAAEFLAEFNISASAMDRVIKRSYALLDLISFFTIGKKEIRAWTIKKRTPAVDAAEVVHSDMKKGFIRAEVVSFDDLMESGSYAEAKKKGIVRLEGKSYQVQDGDIITFRFNV
jgi:GTP-binding protein YchF